MALSFLEKRAIDATLLSYQGAKGNKELEDAAAFNLSTLINTPEANTYANQRMSQTNMSPAITPTTATTPTGGTTPPPTGAVTPTTNDPTNIVSTAPSDTGMSVADLLKEYLESDPRLMLGAALNAFRAEGAANNFTNWFERNFDSFWTRYLGTLAAQAAQGQVPNVSFVDYVKGLDPTGQFFGDTSRNTNRQSQVFSDYVNTTQAAG